MDQFTIMKGRRDMKKGKMMIVVCVLALILGTAVHAEETVQAYDLGSFAQLSVGGIDFIEEGEYTGESLPEGVAYDAGTNTLTLTNARIVSGEGKNGISAASFNKKLTLKLEGDNQIVVNKASGISVDNNLTIEGPGVLTLECSGSPDGYGAGINNVGSYGLSIQSCKIRVKAENISASGFYGITNSLYGDAEDIVIENSDIRIENRAASGAEGYNVGIDAQRAGLVIKNSNVAISLIGGRTVGIGAGNTSANAEGRLAVENSTVKSIIAPTIIRGYANMYFTDIIDKDKNYFYVGEGEDEVKESTFDEIFEEGYKRYQGNAKVIIISSKPLNEYCNHDWDEGEVTKEATCTDAGETTYTCLLCQKTKTEEIPALGHDWGEWKTLKEATCTEDGSRTRICARCNKTETEPIVKSGHDFVETVIKEATCIEAGMKAEKCSHCGYEVKEAEIPALGHSWSTWEVTKEPTFHEDGEETRTCTRCDLAEARRLPQLSESHTHDFSGKEEITKNPTCTEEGSKKVYCTEPECGAFKVVEIALIAHTPGEWTVVKEATCRENGEEQKSCTMCGKVMETRVTDPLPHTYGEWEVTQEATCTEAGVETAKCQVCGETTLRGMEPLGHDYVKWNVTKEVTCTEDGEEESICTRCGEVSTRAIKAAGHSYGEWEIVKEATTETDGEKQAVCEVCGDVKTEVIPKTPVQPTTPEGGDNSGNDNHTGSGDKESGKASGVPATGDTTQTVLWICIMAVAACTVMAAKKRAFRKESRV